MKRTFLAKIQINGLYCAIGALLLLVGIPLYQFLVLIPSGYSNALATQSFGKSATGNRALIIFTDGEELSGDATKTAKAAADSGVRIFTVGVGTPQGSLIPVTSDNGETAFVKDSAGQVVKSKLDEKRLREIAQATGGFYIQLENGPRTRNMCRQCAGVHEDDVPLGKEPTSAQVACGVGLPPLSRHDRSAAHQESAA